MFTIPGERVMRPDFGCGIHDLVFAPLNPITIGDFEYHDLNIQLYT